MPIETPSQGNRAPAGKEPMTLSVTRDPQKVSFSQGLQHVLSFSFLPRPAACTQLFLSPKACSMYSAFPFSQGLQHVLSFSLTNRSSRTSTGLQTSQSDVFFLSPPVLRLLPLLIGGVQILYGNLAPEGSVAKITGKEGLYFSGGSRVKSLGPVLFLALLLVLVREPKIDGSKLEKSVSDSISSRRSLVRARE